MYDYGLAGFEVTVIFVFRVILQKKSRFWIVLLLFVLFSLVLFELPQ